MADSFWSRERKSKLMGTKSTTFVIQRTLEAYSVISFDQGFIIITDNVYYYSLDCVGKLVIEPLK